MANANVFSGKEIEVKELPESIKYLVDTSTKVKKSKGDK